MAVFFFSSELHSIVMSGENSNDSFINFVATKTTLVGVSNDGKCSYWLLPITNATFAPK
jgi:hypothetical protein